MEQTLTNEVLYKPYTCVWELTLKCNMHCKHCGSSAGKARENELTLDECLDVATQIVEIGVKHVSFIGGEVFLYNEWEKIARKLVIGDVYTNIITNGYVMGDEQIEQIIYAGVGNVALSIDGMAQQHNNMRNVNDAFEKITKTIDTLNEADIEIAVITSLLNSNVNELENLYNFILDNNVKIWQLQTVTPMGNMANKKEQLIEPLKMASITKFIREKHAEQKIEIVASDNIGYFDENEPYIRSLHGTNCEWRGCSAGLCVFGIDSVGNVKGCESLYSDEFIEGNLRKESLSEIWNKEGNFAYNRNFDVSMLTGNCKDCDKGIICKGGCRSSGYFATGSKYENPFCQYNIK